MGAAAGAAVVVGGMRYGPFGTELRGDGACDVYGPSPSTGGVGEVADSEVGAAGSGSKVVFRDAMSDAAELTFQVTCSEVSMGDELAAVACSEFSVRNELVPWTEFSVRNELVLRTTGSVLVACVVGISTVVDADVYSYVLVDCKDSFRTLVGMAVSCWFVEVTDVSCASVLECVSSRPRRKFSPRTSFALLFSTGDVRACRCCRICSFKEP